VNDIFEISMAEPADASQILDIYRPFIENTAVTFETEIPSLEEFSERIGNVEGEAPWLVCKTDEDVVGYAYAGMYRVRAAYRWSREVSAYVKEGYRGMGIASGLYTSLIEFLRLQGYCNLLACITIPNPGSIRFHESMGFRHVGTYRNVGFKLDRFHDVGWWELFIGDVSKAPSCIRPVGDVCDSAEGHEALETGVRKIMSKSTESSKR